MALGGSLILALADVQLSKIINIRFREMMFIKEPGNKGQNRPTRIVAVLRSVRGAWVGFCSCAE